MIEKGFTRTDCVVAVGGGMVGDIAAFSAATYMRGIDFYNIPTTVLSQVDSSIGGKTAIDFDGYKNIVDLADREISYTEKNDEEIAMLCDIAMCGDRGIGEMYGSALDLPKTIANGDDICHLRYHKVK